MALRVGIVGAGLMGRWHAKNAARLGVELVSVVDQDLSRAKRLAAEVGGRPAVFTTIDAALQHSPLDIVHLCTPPESHYRIARKLLNADTNVLVEKPVAASLAETQALLQVAEQRSLKLCPVHQFGFQDGVLNALTQLGSMGELLNMRCTIASAGADSQPRDAINRIIADIIPHPLSVLQRLRPGARLDTQRWRGQYLHNGELQLGGDTDGVAIDIYISMNARPSRCEMDLFCSKGRIHLNFFHGYCVVEKGRESRRQKALQPFKFTCKEFLLAGLNLARRGLRREQAYPGLGRLINMFYQSVASNSDCPVSAGESLAIAVAREHLWQRFLCQQTEHANN